MLVQSGFPANFWPEAVSTATYLSNESPKRALNGKTAEELWSVFGCRSLAYIPDVDRNKIQPKSKECKLLGFCTDQKGYRLWDLANKKIITSRDVVFFEDDFSWHSQKLSQISAQTTSPHCFLTKRKLSLKSKLQVKLKKQAQ